LNMAVQIFLKVGFNSLVFIGSTKLWTTAVTLSWNHMQRGGHRQTQFRQTDLLTWCGRVVSCSCQNGKEVSVCLRYFNTFWIVFITRQAVHTSFKNRLNSQALKESILLASEQKVFLKTRNVYNSHWQLQMIGSFVIVASVFLVELRSLNLVWFDKEP
jgi:hypothetical protein